MFEIGFDRIIGIMEIKLFVDYFTFQYNFRLPQVKGGYIVITKI